MSSTQEEATMTQQGLKLLVLYGEKRWEIDEYENGCQPGTGGDYTLDGFPKLINGVEDLAKVFGLDEDKTNWCINPANAPTYYLCYGQLEDGDGLKASPEQIEQWKQGKLVLYQADYDFKVMLIKEETTEDALAKFLNVEIN